MKTVEKKIDLSISKNQPPKSAIWESYTRDLTLSLIDIETTGLSLARDAVILGGQLSFDHSACLFQCLADSTREEKQLLELYVKQLSTSHILVSYNGRRFDLPFLAHRLKKHGICDRLPLHQSIDLHLWFQKYFPLASLLPDLKQGTLEKALGLSHLRTDLLSGKESAKLFESYMKTQDKKSEQLLLLHNSDDLFMLHRLFCVFPKLDLHRIFFEQGFWVKTPAGSFFAEHISLSQKALTVTGKIKEPQTDQDIYSDAYEWHLCASSQTFCLSVHCQAITDTIFIDLEKLPFDFSPLTKYPSFFSGYLLISEKEQIAFGPINHFIKILLKEISAKF